MDGFCGGGDTRRADRARRRGDCPRKPSHLDGRMAVGRHRIDTLASGGHRAGDGRADSCAQRHRTNGAVGTAAGVGQHTGGGLSGLAAAPNRGRGDDGVSERGRGVDRSAVSGDIGLAGHAAAAVPRRVCHLCLAKCRPRRSTASVALHGCVASSPSRVDLLPHGRNRIGRGTAGAETPACVFHPWGSAHRRNGGGCICSRLALAAEPADGLGVSPWRPPLLGAATPCSCYF
jgi:hypothetical protein